MKQNIRNFSTDVVEYIIRKSAMSPIKVSKSQPCAAYQDQRKRLEQKKQDSTRIAEVQEMISEALVA